MAKTANYKQRKRDPAATSKSSAAVAQAATDPNAAGPGTPEISWYARWRPLYVLIPVALAIIATSSSLWNGFAADDITQVLNNEFIKSASNIPQSFTRSVWSLIGGDIIFSTDSYFRPLFNILFIINYALFGTSAWGWHLVNVLVHAAATLLVFLVIKELTDRKWVALIASSLFAVHPVHAESVAWVSGITDPMLALFLLPALYFYLRYRKSGRNYFLAVAVAFYFLALLSKETAIALPLVIAYCELYHFRDSKTLRQRAASSIIMASLFLPPTAVYFLMRYNAIDALLFGGQPRYDLLSSLITMPVALVEYIKFLFVPAGYSYQHYIAPLESPASLRFVFSILLIGAMALGVWVIKSRELKFAAVWFIALLAPSLAAIRQFEPEYLVQERYLYLPSMGFCLALALGVEWLWKRDWQAARARAIVPALTIAIVTVWCVSHMRQNRVWDNDISLYKNCVAIAPDSPVAHASLARVYFDRGWKREAEIEGARALELDPGYPGAYLTLSYFATMSGNLDQAIKYLEAATSTVREVPLTRHSLATVYLNLGLLYSQRKDAAAAEKMMARSSDISPRPVAWYYMGDFYFSQNRFEEARQLYERTLNNTPGWFAQIHRKLGLTYERLGRADEARVSYYKYFELAPPDAKDRREVEDRLKRLQNPSAGK